jgi:hypothetical protein
MAAALHRGKHRRWVDNDWTPESFNEAAVITAENA